MNANEIIDELIRREGGFVNDPDDRGGATKFGVTESTLSGYLGEPVDVDDVQRLTVDEARLIYERLYITSPKLDALASATVPRLLDLLVDSAVQHGPPMPVKWVQRTVGALDDGLIGPLTLDAVQAFRAAMGGDAELFWSVFRQRLEYYGRIIRNDPSQAKFARGLMLRMGEFARPLMVMAPHERQGPLHAGGVA